MSASVIVTVRVSFSVTSVSQSLSGHYKLSVTLCVILHICVSVSVSVIVQCQRFRRTGHFGHRMWFLITPRNRFHRRRVRTAKAANYGHRMGILVNPWTPPTEQGKDSNGRKLWIQDVNFSHSKDPSYQRREKTAMAVNYGYRICFLVTPRTHLQGGGEGQQWPYIMDTGCSPQSLQGPLCRGR